MSGKMKSVAMTVLTYLLTAALLINPASAALGTTAENTTQAAAQELYIESVCTFSAPTKAEAIKKCKDGGYIPVDSDLNEGNDANAVILGYKTTTNQYEAVTDLSVLEMNTGYETKNYSYIVEKEMEQVSKITSALMVSFNEYANNLQNNSPAAIEAKEILDLLYIPEKNNVTLGDYLAGDDCSEDFIKKLFCQANTGIMLTVINTMAAGVTDCTEDNWAQRLVNSPVHRQITAEDLDCQLDREYEKIAKDLRQPLRDFAENVGTAQAFVEKNGYDALKDKDEENTEDYEIPDEVINNITACEELEDKDKSAFYLMAYELLNTYILADGRGVGDYIVSLGQAEYTSMEDVRRIYPLAASLTKGQFGVMRIVGIPQMALSLVNDNAKISETQKYTDELKSNIAKYNKDGSEKLSVWVGTDPIPYTSEIALTYQGIRETASAEEYSDLIAEKQKDKNLNYLMTAFSIGSTVIDSVVVLANITVNVVQMARLGFYGWATAEATGMWALCAHAATAAGTGAIATILGYMGVVLIIGTWVMTAFTVIVLAYMLIDWIIDSVMDEEDVLEYTAEDIPIHVYDYRQSHYMRYDAVRGADGVPCDLNAGKGKRFAALYYSKQDTAGEPIRVDSTGATFKLVKGDTLTPTGYRPVRYFGPGSVADLNSYSENKSAPAIYLFYYAGETTGINEGEQSDAPAGTPYLESLYVAVEKTETAAKDKLKKMGFTPIDKNLTSFYSQKGGTYTYLGYKTTTVASEAITDIRIVPQGIGTGDSMAYGVTTYVRAGEDIPSFIPSIYYGKSSYAGTPVYADLQIVSSKSSAREGFEPVNLFCGGDAYNLNATGDSEYHPYSLTYQNWKSDQNVYIYFHPSVTYTSGEQYIGGLAFFTGKNTSAKDGNEIVQYAKENGFTVWENDFAEDYDMTFEIVRHIGKGKTSSEKTVDNIVTYLGYSTTCNPYRAVYSVKSYTALSDSVVALNEMIVSGRVTVPKPKADNKTVTLSKSFAACNVFYQFCGQIQEDDVKITSFYRGILTSNAWNGINEDSRQEILPRIAEYPVQSAEDYEQYLWSDSRPRLKNLYVSGMIPGIPPLTPDDIKLTDNPEKEQEYNGAGLYSVQDAKTPNRTAAHNIAFSAKKPQYLFVKDEKPHEKKYISALSVYSWSFDATVGKEKSFLKLDDDQKEEMTERYNNMKDDICIVNAIQSAADEVILKNLAVGYSDSVQSAFDNKPKEAAYIGVTRTDNALDAICSIIKFKPQNKSDATLTITVSGTEYTRAGSEPIHDKNGDYYLYYSTSVGCAPNEPITSIDFSAVPLVKDCASALTATEKDVQQRIYNGEVVREGKTGELKGYTGETNYIHSKYETAKTYISDLYIGSGNTRDEAMIDLLNMGCNAFINLDMNKGANGKYVFVGYDRYTDKNGTAKYAVRDLLCTVGHDGAPSIDIDGVTYKRACDRYLYSGDRTKAISFNEGTNGLRIYLYYTTGTANRPVMNLAAGEKDLVPENSDKLVWENVMTTSGRRCDFNDGVFASEEGHDKDTRIYLFAHRFDNSVKDGAGIVSGVTWNTMKYGKLVLK